MLMFLSTENYFFFSIYSNRYRVSSRVMTARFAGFWSGLVYIGAGMAGITAGNLQRRGAANRKMSLVAAFFTCLSALLVSVGFAAFLSIEGLATGETPYVQRLEYAFYALAFIGAYFSVAVAIGTGISLCFYETSLDIYRRNQAESIHVSWQRSAGPGQPQPSGLVTVSGFLQPQPKLHDPPPAYKEATGGFV